MGTPSFEVHTFLAPKEGHSQAECEDALAWNTAKGRFSLADGATEAYNSRRWARFLVKHWTRSSHLISTPEDFLKWIRTLSSRFSRQSQAQNLPWFAEEKAALGSYAAFLGLYICSCHETTSWKTIALGDTCLFLRRADGTVNSLLLPSDESFTRRPVLVPSNTTALEAVASSIVCKTGSVQSGDVLLLMTDALAQWYLNTSRKKTESSQLLEFERLISSGAGPELEKFLATHRRLENLRNDDVAALIVRATNHVEFSP